MNRPGYRALALAALVFTAVAVTGCAGGPGKSSAESEQPVSQQQASSGDPRQRAKIHSELGGLYLGDGRLATALDEGRIAVSADPSYAPAYNLLGLVQMYLQENKFAEENFEHALRLAPDDAEINNNFGWFLCQSKREQRSIAYFQAAIRNPLYSTPAKPLTNAGICSLQLKDDKAAEDYFVRALQADNANVTALFWLAEILYRQDRLGDARLRMKELTRLTEPDAAAVWLAVRIEHKFGDREAEARYASQLRRKFSGTPEYQKLMQGQYQ